MASQLVSTQLDADSLLRAVATAFGIAVKDKDKAGLLAQLEAYLLGLVQQNRKALLIVDEAQNLAPAAVEELRMLSNFQVGNRALLQSFLVGQPQLRDLMRSASMQQLRQRVIAAYHLGPLDPAETRAYIEHRLRHVGWKDDPRFEDSRLPGHPRTDGRHSPAHQHALHARAARRFPRRAALDRRLRRRAGDRRAVRGVRRGDHRQTATAMAAHGESRPS